MLIRPEELYGKLGDENLIIFDCRYQLGSANRHRGREQYLASHIPGAFYLDLELDLSAPVKSHGGRHPLPDTERLARQLGDIGVGVETEVAVYDAGEGMAARAWWLIQYMGHPNVALLDGGFNAWMDKGFETTSDLPVPNPRKFPLNVQTNWVLGIEDIKDIVEGQKPGVLVDARARERYRGEVEPLDPKAGHIPGAWNLPFMEGIDEQGYWKSADAQRDRIEAVLGARVSQSGGESGHDVQLVMYCGSGVTACNNIFALKLAGVDAKLYAGSWSDWSSYDDSPIETGTRPDGNGKTSAR